MKLSVSIFLLLFAFNLSASINPIDLLVQSDPTSHTITLRTATEVGIETKVQILDRRGLVLHTTKLQAGDFLSTRLQVSALPAGEYTVVLSDAVGETVQPLSITRDGVVADASLASRTFYPSVNLNGNRLSVNYLNTGGENVRVTLSDRNGNQVFQEKMDDTPTVQRVYNLDKLPAGNYYVTVNASSIPPRTTSLDVQ